MGVSLSFDSAGYSKEDMAKEASHAAPAIASLRATLSLKDWLSPHSWALLSSEKKFAKASALAAKQCNKAALMLVIGIGGSNLGTIACADFLYGAERNLLHPKKLLLFADTCDPDSIDDSIRMLKSHLSGNSTAVICIASKSGGTAETITNFEAIFSSLSGKEKKKVKIFATTNAGSVLHKLASEKGWGILPIPPSVGGRFSVLSPAGLFPLAWIGADINALLAGAQESLTRCTGYTTGENPALCQAALLSLHSKSRRNILVSFVFSNDLFSYGRWWRQLLSESAGKDGKGLTPSVSVGTTDMHSQAQLYLAGPRDKAFKFVTVAKHRHTQTLPAKGELLPLSAPFSGKSTTSIYSILAQSMQHALRGRRIPYYEASLSDKSERTLGALLALDMASVVFFCHLIGVSPYGQPSVEEYKSEARRLLAKK